jgi:KAP family P-loop domain
VRRVEETPQDEHARVEPVAGPPSATEPVSSLRGIPFGHPLTGYPGWVDWGAWGQVEGRPVLATGGADGQVRLWEVVEERAVGRLPSYRSDATTAVDQLDRDDDAAALADLITARTARPPLAVGLFGDWGEGKTHFLDLLAQRVRFASHRDDGLTHRHVRQVRFNAWHYAEVELWPSLVSELFTQLAQPAEPEDDLASEQQRQSRLTAAIVAARPAREQLVGAEQWLDDLYDEREKKSSWDRLPQQARRDLADAGISPSVYEAVAGSRWLLKRWARQARLALGQVPWWWWAILALIIDVVGLTLVTLVLGAPRTGWTRWIGWTRLTSWVGATLGVLGFAGTALAKARQAVKRFKPRIVQEQDALNAAIQVAEAEVADLRRQVADVTAAGQLAGLVADRAGDGSYRSQLGVMTQIRADFERMADLLAQAARDRAANPRGEGDDLPAIGRIVLYIDDLDRCPPERVVQVLEAIHLLLAVDLFVVIVAVDPRWLLQAIAAHYRDMLHTDTTPAPTQGAPGGSSPAGERGRGTPEQYLEKIFQVVYTLPPLETGGYQRLLRTLVGTRSDQASPPAAAEAPLSDTTAADGADLTHPADRTDHVDDGPESPQHWYGVDLPAARVVERVDPLTLTAEEIALLDLLGPPLLVTTPRGVKRLANSYGLLTALRRQRTDDLEEHTGTLTDPEDGQARPVTWRPYRAGMVLLASLVAYPALGPTLFSHLHHTAEDLPDRTWAQFLQTLRPGKNEQHQIDNEAEKGMTAARTQQWNALLDGLDQLATTAAERSLDLPEPLAVWAEWVLPVGRLSFPTGNIVNSLARRRPLTTPLSP